MKLGNLKYYLTVIICWPVFGSVIGLLGASAYGEHGAGIFFVLGFWLGIIGAIEHAIYLLLVEKTIRVRVTDWMLIGVLVIITALLSAVFNEAQDALLGIAAYGGPSTLVISLCIYHILKAQGWPNKQVKNDAQTPRTSYL